MLRDKRRRQFGCASVVPGKFASGNVLTSADVLYTFERAVHTERKNGELTAARIGELWMDVQYESLGPAIELKPGYETFWCYIPHFIHSPFYVYAYAFGDCLVNSLYAVYENAAEGFAERYLAMLSAGGSLAGSPIAPAMRARCRSRSAGSKGR